MRIKQFEKVEMESEILSHKMNAFKSKVLGHLRKIQRSPEKVKKYFIHGSIRYVN